MAVAIQVCSVGSTVQGIPQIRASSGGSVNLLRSQFLGSGRIPISGGTRKNQVVVHYAATKAGTVRSASFFEKLGQVFSNSFEGEEQVLAVYECNDGTGFSPAPLNLTPHKDAPFPTLGDFVPYTNKVYDASGKRVLGLSAGLCTAIQNKSALPAGAGDRYETTYTHYLGDFGQLSAMGPYYTESDSEMVVTGGTGIFKGARGIVKLHSVEIAIQILYTYYITGIQKLPAELTIPVQPLPAKKTIPVQRLQVPAQS